MNNSPLGKTLNEMGVDALLAAVDTPSDSTHLVTIPTDRIQASGTLQPRKSIEEANLADLANSIKEHGILQPILVRPIGIDKYEIIAGERRFQACQLAEVDSIPCIVKEVNDSDGFAIAVVENLQRESLNPIEAAEALSKLIDCYEHTHLSVSRIVGKSRASVSNLIRLLNLHPEVRDLVYLNRLDMGHARALLSLAQPLQPKAAKHIIDNRLSVRATEKHVKSVIEKSRLKPKKVKKSASNPLEATFPKSSIKMSSNGQSGYVKLPFKSEDQMKKLIDQLNSLV
tara:strand:- start:5569 stop:6423 length:855 start_codon:yes stop_codon:yes gene_type:complete